MMARRTRTRRLAPKRPPTRHTLPGLGSMVTENGTVTLYHGTSAALEESIRANGLEPAPNTQLLWVFDVEDASQMAAETVKWLLEGGELDDDRGLVVTAEVPVAEAPTLYHVRAEWITDYRLVSYSEDTDGAD